jgi:DnaJ-class molecular chaperone
MSKKKKFDRGKKWVTCQLCNGPGSDPGCRNCSGDGGWYDIRRFSQLIR